MGIVLLFAFLMAATYYLLIDRCLMLWKQIPVAEVAEAFSPATRISIVIPARNEAENIAACLNAIAAQNYPANLLEVLVIDDHSTDNTAAIAVQANLPQLRVISLADFLSPEEKKQASKKKASSIGVEQASGQLIVCTDADCEMPANWLRYIAACAENQATCFIAAPVLFHQEQNLIERFQSLDFMGMMLVTGAGIQSRRFFLANGANMAYPREVFIHLGAYSDNIQHASGDDVFMIQKVAAVEPGKIRFLKSPHAVVLTKAKPDLHSFVQQRLRWGTKNKGRQVGYSSWILGFVFLYCWLILGSVLALPWLGKAGLYFSAILLVAKWLADYRLLKEAARFFGRQDLMRFFWIGALFHLMYIAIIGLLSLVIKEYEWKGRRVV
ncbi:MAG TPA: glycosyltransferase [Saprospiraceae bacterium]|nr:glycosyltransferase [Saprospiraceae bacterium]HMQ85288.1 glycosyltransferase [Saprospiraceae bacterium]